MNIFQQKISLHSDASMCMGSPNTKFHWILYVNRLSHDQMHFLYQQLVICSCDTKNNVKTLYFVSEKRQGTVLRGQIALNIIDRAGFWHQSIQR